MATVIISKEYPVYHPRTKQLNDFNIKIIGGQKLHTCRMNYNFWTNRMKPNADLSLRQWTGMPYRSPQKEFKAVLSGDWSIQRVEISRKKPVTEVRVDGRKVNLETFARNDGFDTVEDFENWFKADFEGVIIHFTTFRY